MESIEFITNTQVTMITERKQFILENALTVTVRVTQMRKAFPMFRPKHVVNDFFYLKFICVFVIHSTQYTFIMYIKENKIFFDW